MRPCHLIALTYAQFLRDEVTREELLRLADVAHKAGRSSEYVASDVPKGWRGLGRVGRPPFA